LPMFAHGASDPERVEMFMYSEQEENFGKGWLLSSVSCNWRTNQKATRGIKTGCVGVWAIPRTTGARKEGAQVERQVKARQDCVFPPSLGHRYKWPCFSTIFERVSSPIPPHFI
jgi:hypothetical protein